MGGRVGEVELVAAGGAHDGLDGGRGVEVVDLGHVALGRPDDLVLRRRQLLLDAPVGDEGGHQDVVLGGQAPQVAVAGVEQAFGVAAGQRQQSQDQSRPGEQQIEVVDVDQALEHGLDEELGALDHEHAVHGA
jgi:hypothetical protein